MLLTLQCRKRNQDGCRTLRRVAAWADRMVAGWDAQSGLQLQAMVFGEASVDLGMLRDRFRMVFE